MQRILIGNIKGPQGAQGIQGPQGPVGATGPQGPMPDLVNNALATEAGVAALDAVMGKTLQDQITDLNSKLIHRKTIGTYTDEWISGVTGFVTTNGTEAFLYIPMIWQADVNSVEITSIRAAMRTVAGGYLGGLDCVDLTSYLYSTTIKKAQGIVKVVLQNNDGWGLTNNTPLVGECLVSYTVTA